MSKKGWIFDIKELTVHDGPGIRTTVFFKGCPLRCKWCHNPEGLSASPQVMRRVGCIHCKKCERVCTHTECQPFGLCVKICSQDLISICGTEITAEDLANKLGRNADIFEKTDGGVTISGGEPFMQPDFLLELLEKLEPIHRIVETSGHGDEEVFEKVISNADEIYFDIKLSDPVAHTYWTGVDNALIQKNLGRIIQSNRPFVVRIPVIHGVNDSEENMTAAASMIQEAGGRVQVQLLPYNPFAGSKYSTIGMTYQPGFDIDRKSQLFQNPFFDCGISCEIL